MASPNNDPTVVQVMDDYKAGLVMRQQAEGLEMARRWLQVEDALSGRMIEVSYHMADRKAQGRPVSPAVLYKDQRWRSLDSQVKAEINRYVIDYATPTIERGQHDSGLLGRDSAVQSIQASYLGGYGPAFDYLPVEAIERMVGLSGDGSPLSLLLREAYPYASDAIMAELIKSTALGINPRQTAYKMTNNLGLGLDRILRISRTEQLRVFREATRGQYRESGLVKTYKRLSARNPRTCVACLASDGEIFRLADALTDHPNGRCTLVPVVNGAPEPKWYKGSEWLRDQPPGLQEQVMGRGRFELYQEGRVKISDMRATRKNRTWGDSPQPASVKNLLKIAENQ